MYSLPLITVVALAARSWHRKSGFSMPILAPISTMRSNDSLERNRVKLLVPLSWAFWLEWFSFIPDPLRYSIKSVRYR